MATARVRAGARRRVRVFSVETVRFFSVETATPCFTAYNVKSRIAACSNHLKNSWFFVAKASRNSTSSVTVDNVRTYHLRERRMEVTCTKFFVVTGISILPLWNIQLTFEQEGFRRNKRYD